MPPGRRGRPPGSTHVTRNPQQRISFGPNATNKITKPSPLGQGGQKKLSPKQKKQVEKIIDDAPVESTSEGEGIKEEEQVEGKTLPIRQNESQAVKPTSQSHGPQDKREEEASKLPESQLRRYWAHKEESRIAPRVHQQGLDVHEKILREFDLSSQYGVCACSPFK